MMKKSLLIVLFFICSLSFSFAYVDTTITGLATMQQTNISITVVGVIPNMSINLPINGSYWSNESIYLAYNGTGYFKVWYSIDNSINTSVASSPVQLNIGEGNHILRLYANNSDGNFSYTTRAFNINLTRLIINYSNFKNKGSTTYLEQYCIEELESIRNLTFEIPSYGKIRFNQSINVSDSLKIGNIININDLISISNNNIEVDSDSSNNYNSSATLTLYGLSYSDPRILRNGEVCPTTICTRQSYVSGALVFNVTKFTIYSSQETPTTTPPGGSTLGGGGGGGGGGGATLPIEGSKTTNKKISVRTLEVNPLEELKISIEQGQTKKQEIIIKNIGKENKNIKVYGRGLDDILRISNGEFMLSPGEEKTITAEFKAGANLKPDNYVGYLFVETDDDEIQILSVVDVSASPAYFDIKIEIPNEFKTILSNKNLFSTISIYNLGKVGKTDVLVRYLIKNEKGEVVYEENETVSIETQTSLLKQFKMPQGVTAGKYILNVLVEYKEKIATNSATFNVKEKVPVLLSAPSGATLYLWILIVLAFAIIIAFLIIILKKRRKKKEKRNS